MSLGKINSCLGIGLLLGLNGEPEAAQSFVGKAFGHLKDLVPYSGVAENGVSFQDAHDFYNQAHDQFKNLAPPADGKLVPIDVQGSPDPGLWANDRKPFSGDIGGAEIGHSVYISPDERPSNVETFKGVVGNLQIAKSFYDYFSQLSQLRCE